ncbi:hypothetical protein ACFQFH_17820 [Halobaculum halobium]|uniref:HTH domain protein n=1 Tax=Halobaculum halobium TaxID=3032281 RepID=A0ABD5THX4_9EURY|nr:hypothetical protein [Halobaculum sp. SYNS20]
MQSVRGSDGTRYLLVKRSSEASLVRDPSTGEEQYLPNDNLDPVGESPLSAAAAGVSPEVRRAVLACRDERSLGLLVEFADRGGLSVRTLLDAYDLCESDLHGLVAEFRAAGLLAEATVAGERGYEPTDEALAVVERLRG